MPPTNTTTTTIIITPTPVPRRRPTGPDSNIWPVRCRWSDNKDGKEGTKVSMEKSTSSSSASSSATPTLSYSLGHMGVGGNAIATAASQAIAATQQMNQGRRTASLKASYDAINLGLHHSPDYNVSGADETY